MSQYPYPYGYGQYYGQPPPPPYAYQNAPSYAAPSHNDPYNPFAAQIHRDASQAAFSSNATHIPGLGIGGTAPGAPQPNFAPNVAGWGQGFGFPAPAPSAPQPQTSGASSFDSQPSQSSLPTGDSRKDAKSFTHPAPPPAIPATDVDMEEGELSEGQFEDLYEPRENVPDAPTQTLLKVTAIGDPSQPTSAADTPDGGFYASDEEDGGKDTKGNEGRERSASYSPFLSPRELQSDVPTPQPVADKETRPSPSKPALPGAQLPNRPPVAGSVGNASVQFAGTNARQQKDATGSFKSLQEAKKEAQKAILRLWPLGVKYQNYIDEGFDEKVIKGLFRDLHLDMPKTAADSSVSQPKETHPRQSGASNSTQPPQPSDTHPQQPTSGAKEASTMTAQSKNGEERKDRIARLLAAKAAKAPTAPNPPAPVPKQIKQTLPEAQPQETALAPPTTAPPKSKVWGEKERLLQQKIAALQKSRAQKSTTDSSGSAAGQLSSNGIPVPQASGSPAPLAIPTGPRAASLPQPPAPIVPPSSLKQTPIASLGLSPDTQPNPPSQRKRPVASDFVEYSAGPTSPKRPFGQVRKETSLIIDVSDVSDDEDVEMEMDMGSPVDETLPIQSSGVHGQRGPAIRDFPPLTDIIPQRQFSSPAPSVTPPAGTANNKRHEIELSLKEKAIQEMRRKIALAEARRKVKQSSGGSVTPSQAAPTPELGDNDVFPLQQNEAVDSLSSPDRSGRASPQLSFVASPARLPKPAEVLRLDPQRRAERRGRLMSLEIPQVESSLQDKLKRLQELQDEQARLKAEIDQSFAEQKRLAEELQQLDTTPSAGSPCAESLQLNGLLSGPETSQAEEIPPQPVEEMDDQRETQESIPSIPERSQDASVPSAKPTQDESPLPSESVTSKNDIESRSERTNMPLGDSSTNSSDSPTGIEPSLPEDGEDAKVNVANLPAAPLASQPVGTAIAPPYSAQQLDAAKSDEATPMDLDSYSLSPEVAEPASDLVAEDGNPNPRQPSSPLLEQISSVAQPREAVQEIETDTAGEVHVVSSRSPGTLGLTEAQAHDQPAAKSNSTLMPYESPLRYFRAYRFHPEYHSAVSGGLKSLTYSNRIDPDKELCPFELNGEQCPANCEFQHLAAISVPDDQTLLELGNPDDYTGELKSRFIQGLRELLTKFKTDKVKDFDTIARGIIAFRAQLLGDKSKVLQLDGVTI